MDIQVGDEEEHLRSRHGEASAQCARDLALRSLDLLKSGQIESR